MGGKKNKGEVSADEVANVDEVLPAAAEEARQKALYEALAPEQVLLGLPVANYGADGVPMLYIKARAAKDLAADCVANILRSGVPMLFMLGDAIVTIDEGTGRIRGMDAKCFRSWVEHYMVVTDRFGLDGRPVSCVMPMELTQVILASYDFQCKLPKLRGVNLVKQPVWRRARDGMPERVELLAPGYDAESQIFTVRMQEKGMDYAEDWSLLDAYEFLDRHFQYFPWGGPDGLDPLKTKGVSFAATLAMWLTHYGMGLLPPQTPTPAFLQAANNPGSGKTRMVEIILLALYGSIVQLAWPQEKRETDKLINTIDSMLLGGSTYLFFDNLPEGQFGSPLLEGLITSGTHSLRLYHAQTMSTVEKRCVVMLTGNKITLNQDMGERSIICDFWAEEESTERTLPKEAVELSQELLKTPGFRGKFLSCMWALVRHGYEPEVVAKGANSRHARFPVWSRCIASVVTRCGFADPTTKRKLAGTGNTEGDDLRDLRNAIVSKYASQQAGNMVEIHAMGTVVPMARQLGLCQRILGTVDDMMREIDRKRAWKSVPDEDGNDLRGPNELTEADKRDQAAAYITGRPMATMIGKGILDSCRGQFATDEQGRKYRFGRRGESRRDYLTIERLKA